MTDVVLDSPDTPAAGRKNPQPLPSTQQRPTAKPAWPISSACPGIALPTPMAPNGELVSGSDLIAQVEGNFPELTLEVGRRLHLEDTIVVEWTCNYGDGR